MATENGSATEAPDDFDAAFDTVVKEQNSEAPPADASTDTAAADKAAADKVIADKAAADAAAVTASADDEKAIADKAAADKVIADKAAADKVVADKAAADKVIADKAAADKAIADAGKTAEQLAEEARVAKEAEDKATADKVIADKAAADAVVAAKVAARTTPAAETAEEKTARETREQATAEQLKDYAYSTDETKAVEEFKKNFPGEHVAVTAMFKEHMQKVRQMTFNSAMSVLQQVDAVLTPLQKTVTVSSLTAHEQTLRTAHPDFDAVLPKVEEWVKTQPAYLQTAYDAVLENGTTKDVVDLVTRYKTESGITTQAPAAGGDTKVVTAAPAAKPGATAAEIAALAAGGARNIRQAPAVASKKGSENFDDAFDEAAKNK